MIDKINDKINGNGVYDYSGNNKRKNPAVRAYENTPGTKEAAQKKAGRAKTYSSKEEQGDQGVILDLSSKKVKAKEHASGQKKDFSWTKALHKLFTPVIQWLKDFWESAPQEEQKKEEDVTHEILETALTEASIDDMEELPPLDAFNEMPDYKSVAEEAVKSGNMERLEQMLTQNGTRHLAHNSDLLTYYDRRGKLVDMDETERYRVLFGDKNVLKL